MVFHFTVTSLPTDTSQVFHGSLNKQPMKSVEYLGLQIRRVVLPRPSSKSDRMPHNSGAHLMSPESFSLLMFLMVKLQRHIVQNTESHRIKVFEKIDY